MSPQRIRRNQGQWLVVTCLESGRRFKVGLQSIKAGNPPVGTLVLDDPDGSFDVQPAESYIPARATVNAIRDVFAPARDQ